MKASTVCLLAAVVAAVNLLTAVVVWGFVDVPPTHLNVTCGWLCAALGWWRVFALLRGRE